MTPRAQGVIVGLLLAGASWFGNVTSHTSPSDSIYPDLLSLFVLPISLYFILRGRAGRGAESDRRALRRVGWTVVLTASIVFAVASAVLSATAFAADEASTVAWAFASALVVTAIIGIASVEAWVRLFARVRAAESKTQHL